MEQELIIAEILRDKPHGIKLYSPIFGDCTFCHIKDESSDICVRRPYNEISYFNFDGVYHTGGECLLFPSKEMRDWSKFAWKKGDILVNKDNAHIIFEKFSNDTYTTFIGKHYFDGDNEFGYSYIYGRYTACTQQFHIEKDDAVQTYISNIEKEIGGKLDFKTLEVENEQPEFKDGDIVMSDSGTIVLVRGILTGKIYYHAYMRNEYIYINQIEGEFFSRISRIKRFATDSEKQQLFKALAKEGKAWDAEKKQIVDIKKEHQFKPFEKVLVRDTYEDAWRASFFSHIKENDGRYVTTCVTWKFCIPYEGNEHLLGTKNNPK